MLAFYYVFNSLLVSFIKTSTDHLFINSLIHSLTWFLQHCL
jgi:hypothetical protein